MQTHQRIWKAFQKHRVVNFVVKSSLATIIGLLAIGGTLNGTDNVAQVQARSIRCRAGERTYTVVRGDTLTKIAARYRMSWLTLAKRNHIANVNQIYSNQRLCIPGDAHARHGRNRPGSTSHHPLAVGYTNVFPYGSCTWWANYRYHQIHGVYVPWRGNANAWQWVARAYEYGWQVSSRPTVGSIIDMQPGVQGAYAYGHVAVVEQVLSNGIVVASSMNWGAHPWAVTTHIVRPGSGVAFIFE